MSGVINIQIKPRCAVCDAELEVYMQEPPFKTDTESSQAKVIPTASEGVTTVYESVYQQGILYVEPCKNGCQREEVHPY